ncbi:MAG: hypothetical protein J3K34DRAFT_2737 [Monoraphidium minutum]|nr:MAG: hypothetical protein J3K34DRAFT_2737 [Monoraphidium minutum]
MSKQVGEKDEDGGGVICLGPCQYTADTAGQQMNRQMCKAARASTISTTPQLNRSVWGACKGWAATRALCKRRRQPAEADQTQPSLCHVSRTATNGAQPLQITRAENQCDLLYGYKRCRNEISRCRPAFLRVRVPFLRRLPPFFFTCFPPIASPGLGTCRDLRLGARPPGGSHSRLPAAPKQDPSLAAPARSRTRGPPGATPGVHLRLRPAARGSSIEERSVVAT